MYYRRTFTCNKDAISASAAGLTTPWCRNLGLAFAVIALLMLTGPGLVAQPVVGSGDLNSEWIQDEISSATRGTVRYRGTVVVDSTSRNAVFGLRAFGSRWCLWAP